MAEPPSPVFYFDFACVESYLAAERIAAASLACEWQPVCFSSYKRSAIDKSAIQARAAGYGLPPIRWPKAQLRDPVACTLAAIYAKQLHRTVAFSLAALRQAFAAGRDLAVTDNVLIAAASCELHPRAVLKGIESRAVNGELERARDQALRAGVSELPALVLGSELVVGSAVAASAYPPMVGT